MVNEVCDSFILSNELPQWVTHTENHFLLKGRLAFTKTYSILQNHLPEKVPEQLFPHCE